MSGPDPAVAATRSAVRRALADLPAEATVLVACSGGADSLALLAAAVFEAGRPGARPGRRIVGVSVDHGLQQGSAQRATAVAETMRGMGAASARTMRADAVPDGVPAGQGPEAAARAARYAALEWARAEERGDVVLLGHTRDDQAETVLLGLARGSGARSLAGMRPVTGVYRRPFLALGRAQTRAACRAQDLEVWEDPHNADPAFTRVRVRRRVLPVLEDELGPGVAEALARTGDLLTDDADLLDELAGQALTGARTQTDPSPAPRTGPSLPVLSVPVLTDLAPALRRRVLRLAALEAGCPATELFRVHVRALEDLVVCWRGQRGVDLPGPVHATRDPGPGPGPAPGPAPDLGAPASSGAVISFRPGPVAG